MKQSPTNRLDTGTPTDNPQRRADQRRRRLLGAGLSTPVLMTLTSRPSWAGGGVCTPSAMASADLSGRHTFEGCGKSAGFWMVKQDSWPLGVSKTQLFSSVFGTVSYKKRNGTSVTLFDGMTLGQVIAMNGTSPSGGNPHNIGLHVVGAYCNAMAFGDAFSYTPEQIKNMLLDAAAFGSAAVETLAGTLENANNEFDNVTEWPH